MNCNSIRNAFNVYRHPFSLFFWLSSRVYNLDVFTEYFHFSFFNNWQQLKRRKAENGRIVFFVGVHKSFYVTPDSNSLALCT